VTSLVVDASVTLAWCFGDESDDFSEAVLESVARDGAAAPGIWALEVLNVLQLALRRGRLRPDQYAEAVAFVQSLPIEVESTTLSDAVERVAPLAGRNGTTVYDACYLDLARRRGLPLASLDQGLRRAAPACGVVIFGSSGERGA
jgi:predicted nucleic acid-binding protein